MKDKTFNRLCNIGVVISIIVLIPMSLTLFQTSRYVEDVYDCSDMSLDCGKFFTSIGIKTRYVYGWRYINISTIDKHFHIWLNLDFGLFKLPFESTVLLFISPTIVNNYNEIKTMDYYSDNLKEIWGNDIFTR